MSPGEIVLNDIIQEPWKHDSASLTILKGSIRPTHQHRKLNILVQGQLVSASSSASDVSTYRITNSEDEVMNTYPYFAKRFVVVYCEAEERRDLVR